MRPADKQLIEDIRKAFNLTEAQFSALASTWIYYHEIKKS